MKYLKKNKKSDEVSRIREIKENHHETALERELEQIQEKLRELQR